MPNTFGTHIEAHEHLRLQASAHRRLNVGCGQHPLPYWTNVDEAQDALCDLRQHVPPLPYADASLDDIYAGHFLEHLLPGEATEFLHECYRCLAPGGRLGVLVPDTREVMKRYVRRDLDEVEYPLGTFHPVSDLNAVCAVFLYSTIQDSPHRWCYDSVTLRKLLVSCGFEPTQEIDRFRDPRLGSPQWYQCGWDAVKR